MSNEEFIQKCKDLVAEYAIEHLDKTDEIPEKKLAYCPKCLM